MKKVSFYKNSWDCTSQSFSDFQDVVNSIKCAPSWLIEKTNILRALYSENKTGYRQEKSTLPMFAASGTFKYRNSNLSNLIEYSNIVIMDFDWDNPSDALLEQAKSILVSHASSLHLYAVWRSPAKGLKAAVLHDNTNPALHSYLVKAIRDDLFLWVTDPIIDMNCTDFGSSVVSRIVHTGSRAHF